MADPGVGVVVNNTEISDDKHGYFSFGLGIKKAPVWGLNG